MFNTKIILQNEISDIFEISKNEIKNFYNLGGSNINYSFVIKNEKYVVHKLNDNSIMDWKQEKEAYKALESLNITDELVYYENGIKITKFLHNCRILTFNDPDMIESLELLRKIHESGATTSYHYNIIENMQKYISHCENKFDELKDFYAHQNEINTIQAILDKLNVTPTLCHGDACVNGNFLRLPDKSIKIIDWEQAGMADPLLDIAILTLHQGFKNVDPVWCLHQYLKRAPKKQEYLRLYSFLALDSYALMAWCIYENPDDYDRFLKSAIKYSELVLNYYKI